MALDEARLKELADELDRIGGSIPSPRNRQIGRVAAELRGEEIVPTPNEARQAERLQATAEQAAKTAAAAQAAAQAAQAATGGTSEPVVPPAPAEAVAADAGTPDPRTRPGQKGTPPG